MRREERKRKMFNIRWKGKQEGKEDKTVKLEQRIKEKEFKTRWKGKKGKEKVLRNKTRGGA